MTETLLLGLVTALGAACLGWAINGFSGAIGAVGFVVAVLVGDSLAREEVNPVDLAVDILGRIDNTCSDELDALREDVIDIIKDALREPK